MHRAQVRDAARSKTFYFRKNVLPPGHSSPTASTASSGNSSPVDSLDCGGALRRKETKLRNCFPALQRPVNGEHRGPVEDEYEEMSMDQIMNGKVGGRDLQAFLPDLHLCLAVRCISGLTGSRQCLCGYSGCRPKQHTKD
jgi:hypothetical protein